ncbi:lipopolysaccharide biosynthesis protein [Sphingomonas sp. NSE70-1]|uniref:Lipopolysaccharide biosynthesis protein n=1 Tax=Sphingomonas caseinilyticus TaxID=2908205 RepID=A0ABT0RQS2_9SPHN|nr:lipopolysaccharide biosynthesis protein [Sphingomonas caseinilyticus]MCL6697368.1 lipopolysaccharide biosynthesis protein [Sphingomonas caseinilyticus]
MMSRSRSRVAEMLAEGRQVIHASMSSLALRIAGLASTFLLGVLLARLLGPAQFGIYGLVTTLAALGMSAGLLGTPQLAVREFSIRKDRGDWAGIRSLFKRFGLATAAASALIAVIAILVGATLDSGDGSTISLLLPGAALMMLIGVTSLLAAELRGLGQLFRGQVMDIFARPVLTLVVMLSLLLAGIGLTATLALWAQVFVALIAAIVSFAWIRGAIPRGEGQTDTLPAIPWAAAALPLGAVDILRQLDGAYGVVMMGWLASDEALGIFRVAVACSVVVAMPVTILHVVLAPRLGPLQKSGRVVELQQLLSRTSMTLVLAVVPITLAAWLIGRDLIELVFGPAYGSAWLPLFLMCVAQLVFAFFGMGPILLAMCEGERHLIRIYLFSVGLGMLAAVPLIMEFGPAGAAAAIILSNGSTGFLSWRWGLRRLGVDSTLLPLLRSAA